MLRKLTIPRARGDVDADEDEDEDEDECVDGGVDGDATIRNSLLSEPPKDTTEQGFQNFIRFWNQAIEQTGANLSKVRILNDGRRERIAAIQRQMPGKDAAQAIYNIMRSPFCNGDTKARNRPVDFDWVTQIENFTAALEGNL